MSTKDAYPPGIAALLREERLNPLGPGRPNEAVRPLLAGRSAATVLAPLAVRDPDMAAACLAGLWLYHDFLDESHSLSQDLATPTGSYWHGLMHRREPDAANSKYWFRQVGAHPVLAQLVAEAPALGYPYTTPFAFVEFCEHVRGTGTSDEGLAQRVQQLEWRLLFEHCYQGAIRA